MPDTTLTSAELDDNAVAKAMEAFVSSVRGQDPEWTDEYDEEITLVSPSGDFFAPEYPIRDAIKAYLARAGLEAGKAEESMREALAPFAAVAGRPAHPRSYGEYQAVSGEAKTGREVRNDLIAALTRFDTTCGPESVTRLADAIEESINIRVAAAMADMWQSIKDREGNP